MKDLVIKGKWIRRELIILSILLLIAVIINIIGIVQHNTKWIELLSQLHVVVLLTIILYVLLWVIRLIIILISLPFKKQITKAQNE